MTDATDPAPATSPKAWIPAVGAGLAAMVPLVVSGQSLWWSALPALSVFGLCALLWRSRVAPEVVPAAAPSVKPVASGEPAVTVAQQIDPALIDAFALPLIVTDGNAMVIGSSASAQRIFPGIAYGRPVSLAIRDPDFLEAVTLTMADQTSRVIMLIESAALDRALRVHVNPVPSAVDRRGLVMAVFEDLTEQRATERMRVDFIANASHELRTPLASLLGFIETLQGPAREDHKARERFLPIMREQAGRMSRLIDDLLSLSRAELRAHQQPTSPIDLTSIVREIIDSLSLSAKERGVMLEVGLPSRPALIKGDRDDLLRLVENLVENGIRYGRDGGRVLIAVTEAEPGPVTLSVRDHGPGIAPEHIPRLTERFYRADLSHSREVGGTGLGLAIVKHLVARHRARLEIESVPGDGATFRVIFPA
ncbi:MAG: ATP-binding protein [Hyphomicrobiales bacterium]|nr:ATP-binding protein [Hyphomicrobiales bacterium]